ncbi:hypothetical protein CSC70_03995 [Pseudoxanthomonas kalamensis DSM 18571]|nr:hypothetical protein CSC70_03995 [Pseudoxanthomonas kalamensis DSM 18571]
MPLVPGYNSDRIDITAGMQELRRCGYEANAERDMVIEYALARWKRGEEEQAQRGAIDKSFHGITLTAWLRVISAAMVAGETNAAPEPRGVDGMK